MIQMKTAKLFFLLFTFSVYTYSQQIKLLNSEKKDISFRGLSVVNDSVFWISGSKGVIGMSADSGQTINWISPNGFEDRDFRAIVAFDENTALTVAVSSPAVILKTTDGGRNWKEVFRDDHSDVFLDDMSFNPENQMTGIVIGDAIDGEPYLLKTTDAGENWHRRNSEDFVELEDGEAFFAASNSNLKMIEDEVFFAVSGGSHSNLIYINRKTFQKINLDKTNSQTSGANGMDYSLEQNYGLIVGGDFMDPKSSSNNLFIFKIDENGTPQISKPAKSPDGYKSGVTILDNGRALSCGMLNVFYSEDNAENWRKISTKGFHSCKKAKSGQKVFLTGNDGRIAVLED